MTDRDTANADALVQRGLALLEAGTPHQAARTFLSAVAADDRHLEAHYGLVRAWREAGHLERSIGAALALTVLTPRDPAAHAALALALREGGHHREAETATARSRALEWKNALEAPSEATPPDQGRQS
jgi:tetratricopeptide (TPR) repeat protein